MRESGYTAAVGRLLPPGVYPLKLSLPYTAGVADSWYDGNRGDLWVEWKHYNPLPRTIDLLAGKNPKLTRLQYDWLKRRHANGRNVAVIVASPQGGIVMRVTEIEQPIAREEFLARALNKRGLAAWIASEVSCINACNSPE